MEFMLHNYMKFFMAHSKSVANGKKTPVAELQNRIKELEESIKALQGSQFTLNIMTEKMIMVNQISKELNTLDIDKIGETAVKRIAPLIGAKYASFFMY